MSMYSLCSYGCLLAMHVAGEAGALARLLGSVNHCSGLVTNDCLLGTTTWLYNQACKLALGCILSFPRPLTSLSILTRLLV